MPFNTKEYAQRYMKDRYNKDPEFKKTMNNNTHNYYIKLKIKVFSHYCGGIDKIKCSCQFCDVTEVRFLTIDHDDNDGAEHRRKLGIRGGVSTYLWLVKNNYPEGFSVKCYNCNCGKDKFGICHYQLYSSSENKSSGKSCISGPIC